MKKTNKVLSLVLAVLLCVGMLPMSVITVFAASMTVNVEMPSGETVTLDVEPADSIENVKQKMQDKTGLKPETIFLYFEDKLLEDGRTLADYNIQSGSKLKLTLLAPEDTGETHTLTIIYAVEDSNGIKIGTEIEDKVITGITPGTVIDLSDYWPDKMSVTGSNGETYYFLNHSEYSNNINSPLYRWVADKNDVIYAHYAGIGLIRHAPYELTFDPNGGAVDCQKILYLSFPFTDLSSEDQLVPVRDGYRFLGWSLDKNELSNQYDVVKQSGTLYAIWEELPSVQVGMTTLYDGEYTTDGINKTAGEPTGEGYAYYKNGVLILNNFSYTSGGNNKAAIYATNDLTINAVGTNTIDSTEEYAIYLKGDNLTIEGDVLNLAVIDAEKAIATLTLYNDFDGTYGKLNITDVTLNIENKSDDQSYGIRCRDVLIDGSTLTVNMKMEKQHRSTGLDANGTVAIVRNSQVVIDLSEATTGSALIADGSVSVSDSYVELRGDANDGTGLSFNTSYRTLDFNGGTLIISGSRDPGGAIYMYSATIELPDGDYWWRTDENGSYSKGDYTYNKNQTYIEITTSKLQNEWVSTPTIRGWIYNTVKSTPQAEAKYGTVEFKYYDADKNLLTELPDNAGTYYLKGFVLETNNYTGLESDYVWFAIEKDEQIPPRPTGVNTTYIDTNDGKITGVDSTMEYRKEGDANYTAVTGTEITGLAPGKYYVRYAEKANYNPSPDNVITVSLGGKRIIAIAENPTSSRVIIGGKLSDSVLTGGIARDADAVWISGTYTWKDGTEVLDTKGIFQKTVIFTPDNNAYETVEFDVDVTVVICDTASGEHDFTEQMNNADEHWIVCAKCKTEETDSREAHKGGTATCTAKAECTECGEAYGAEPSHGETEIRNAKPTSCDEEGYTGDTHCKVCGEKLETGTAIAKTAHTFEKGKCTVCGAIDPDYNAIDPPTGDSSLLVLWACLLLASATGIAALSVFSRKRKL